jgi:hypothetical protein
MIYEIKYQFNHAQDATRFLNTLTPWSEAPVIAKFYRSDLSVLVSYEHNGKGFDYTCAKLDDLADSMGGSEI